MRLWAALLILALWCSMSAVADARNRPSNARVPPTTPTPAPTTAALRDQLRSIEAERRTNKGEMRLLSDRLSHLSARRDTLSRQADAAARAARASVRSVGAARDRLARSTIRYIDLAGAVGAGTSDSEAAALAAAVDAAPEDATLVYAVTETLLERRGQELSRLRAAAREAAVAEADGRDARLRADTALARVDERREAVRDRLRWSRRTATDLVTLRRLIRRAIRSAAVRATVSIAGDGVLTGEQAQFSYQLSALTGLDVNVIRAWTLAEMSGEAARRRVTEGSNNWLNIGYFDALQGRGAFERFDVWRDPIIAANASAAFLFGKWLGASPGIRRILLSVKESPAEQITAIATSGWASSGYYNGASLRGTYRLVQHVQQPPRTTALIVIDAKTKLRVP